MKKAVSNHNLLSDEIVKKAHFLGGIMENRFDPKLNGKHALSRRMQSGIKGGC